MDSFLISGIQQIGVGTTDFRMSWNWYIDMFGIDVKILEELRALSDGQKKRLLAYASMLRNGKEGNSRETSYEKSSMN